MHAMHESSSIPACPAKAVHAPEGDCRDWDALDAFAGEIVAELSAEKAGR